jgi:tRNA-Thr(GGU) m(6)t(6)A37 methyltransferase TsaA
METIVIDGEAVPLESIYGYVEPIPIRPIGYVARGDAVDGERQSGNVSEIRLLPGMARFMQGIEEESHILVLWHFDQARPPRSVFPRGWDGKEVGMFASRTPHRLTPIGATEVELLAVRGTTLLVRGLEAFDRTPVLDIKVAMRSLREGGRGERQPDADESEPGPEREAGQGPP